MSLWFQPKPRSVVYCDFAGFRLPEMAKRRPVIVLRVHKRNRRLVYVVPLSTSVPIPMQSYHFHFARSPVVHDVPKPAWAKCDMVAVVSTKRLSLGRTRNGPMLALNSQSVLMISELEFESIRKCVAIAFGFGATPYVCDGKTFHA